MCIRTTPNLFIIFWKNLRNFKLYIFNVRNISYRRVFIKERSRPNNTKDIHWRHAASHAQLLHKTYDNIDISRLKNFAIDEHLLGEKTENSRTTKMPCKKEITGYCEESMCTKLIDNTPLLL